MSMPSPVELNFKRSGKASNIKHTEFEVFISKADFKFNCAHFIAYKGFRERLHGHNYTVSINAIGNSGLSLNEDGYLIDFGDIKAGTRKICKELNEYFICPMRSDVIDIQEINNQMCLTCQDGSNFVFPRKDCVLLPIQHSSAEELAHYIYCRLVRYLICILSFSSSLFSKFFANSRMYIINYHLKNHHFANNCYPLTWISNSMCVES